MNNYNVAQRINSDVNASVTYKTDLEQYGKPEHWCLPTASLHDKQYAKARAWWGVLYPYGLGAILQR